MNLGGFDIKKKSNKPFTIVKWTGGKTRMVKAIKPLIQSVKFDRYFEPFCGGAAVFFNLDLNCPSFLNDEAPIPYTLFNALKGDVNTFYDEFKVISDNLWNSDGSYYYDVRKKSPDCTGPEWLFLTQACFNGLIRFSTDGKWRYTSAWGHRYAKDGDFKERFYYPVAEFMTIDKVEIAHEKLENATITRDDYRNCVKEARKGDFVYLDPPYLFNGKDEDSAVYGLDWSKVDEEILIDTIFDLDRRGVNFLLSNVAYSHGKRNDYLMSRLEKFTMQEIEYGYKINPLHWTESSELLVRNF